MLLLNKVLLYVNVGLVLSNLYLHNVGLAALAAICAYFNLTAIRITEEINNGLRNRE